MKIPTSLLGAMALAITTATLSGCKKGEPIDPSDLTKTPQVGEPLGPPQKTEPCYACGLG